VARERYETSLEFAYRGPRALLSLAVPPLLLQPLVENSLKHGITPGGDALHLTLDAKRAGDWIELEFADDGEPHGNGGPSLGTGLENLEQRVRRFAGNEASVTSGPRCVKGGAESGFAVRMRWLASQEDAR
jgi:LytS/YehU family sensor histidine kinase